MWEAFDERAKRVLFLSRYEAFVAKSDEIKVAHLLLGILLEADPGCTRVIEESGANAEPLAEFVRQRPRKQLTLVHPSWLGTTLPGREIGFAVDVKAILARARSEAQELGHEKVEVAHLLLALLAVSQAGCEQALSASRLSYDAVRLQLLRNDH